VRTFRTRHREALIAATVRLVTLARNGTAYRNGTGFFIAPGRVVTCAHVVPELDGAVYLAYCRGEELAATVLAREPAKGADKLFSFPDVALLEVELADHPSVALRTALPDNEDQLYAYGYPLLDGRPFADHMFLRAVAPLTEVGSGNEFLKTTGDQVRGGASGSPVLDDTTGELVGMINQTRDQNQNLGAVLVPTAGILDALGQAAPTLAEDNAAATEETDSAAAVRRRLRWVLQDLRNVLAVVDKVHQQSMLMKLFGEPPQRFELDDVADALLNLQLDELTAGLRELARAARDVDAPERLLGYTAPFAWITSRPWVEPDVAEQLAAERRSAEPRVIRLPVSCNRSVQLHLSRAGVDGAWTAVPLTGRDGADDPETGLPARLVDGIRCELLDRVDADYDPADPADIRRAWLENVDDLRTYAKEWAFILPPESADTALVAGLRRHFAPFIFLTTDRQPSAARLENPAMLPLPTPQQPLHGKDDESLYDRSRRMIYTAADRRVTR
jgi:hypothetical protein